MIGDFSFTGGEMRRCHRKRMVPSFCYVIGTHRMKGDGISVCSHGSGHCNKDVSVPSF